MKKRISIIIPVLNEEQRINKLIYHLMSQVDNDLVEIIVVDGSSAGNTLKSITVSGVVKTSSPKGRGLQMNKGALLATGDVLFFLHADTILPDNALKSVLVAASKERFAGGAFDLEIDSVKPSLWLIGRAASLRSRLTQIPYGDQAIFIKAQLFKQIGGYKDIAVMEDVELMQRIKRNGWKIKILKEKVKTSSRRWDKEGIVYCTLRNWAILVLFFGGVSPEKLGKVYK